MHATKLQRPFSSGPGHLPGSARILTQSKHAAAYGGCHAFRRLKCHGAAGSSSRSVVQQYSCAPIQGQAGDNMGALTSRREWLGWVAATAAWQVGSPASADEAAVLEAPASGPRPPSIIMKEDEYEFYAPGDYNYIETQQPIPERGPAPERSPVRVRFDSPDGKVVISVIVRNAQTLKQMLTQVTDLPMFGDPNEVAQLLLPRGSKILSVSILEVKFPPQEAPIIGTVEVPPKNYFRYNFVTQNGLHVYMQAAASKGKVWVCSASMPKDLWESNKDVVMQSVNTFRVNSGPLTKLRPAP